MERLSRVRLYQNMIEKSTSEPLLFVLQVNVRILVGVEELFLTEDINNIIQEFYYNEFISRLRSNLQRLEVDIVHLSWRKALIILKERISRLLLEYEKKDGTNRKNERNLFNQLIKELSFFNGKIIKKEDFIKEDRTRDDRSQVFLSHAYIDRAYTWALFEFFYEHGIYLYIDWMHNDEEKDGRILKSGLKKRLNQSSQLLFLRTLNSELDIQGKQYIKPWCSWELGNFYNGNNSNEKYLLNLYSVDNYKNVQLHGLKLYTGVSDGKLVGTEIEP